MCFDFLYNLCLKHFSFYDEMQETGQKMYIRPHVKYALFLSDFGETWILSTHLRKIFKYQVSLKSAQWDPSYSMRTYRRAWIYESLFAILPTRQGKQPPPLHPLPASSEPHYENNCTTLFRAAAQDTVYRWMRTDQPKELKVRFWLE